MEAERVSDRVSDIEFLKGLLPKGATVFLMLRHRNAGKTVSSISCMIPCRYNDGSIAIQAIDYCIAVAIDKDIDPRHGGVKVLALGKDPGNELTIELSMVMYGESNALHYVWL